MHGMPGPRVQASPGGTSPRTEEKNKLLMLIKFEDSRETEEEVPSGGKEGLPRDVPGDGKEEEGEEALWVRGAQKSDNERYKEFLAYMEEKREEKRRAMQEDEERKKEARRKEDSWHLLREASSFLKKNANRWQERRIEECERVRREEKEDRLAIVKEKKKRYGLKKMSKEENMRMKERTEEKLLMAKIRSNLWKRYREGRQEEEEEGLAWRKAEEAMADLEDKEDLPERWGGAGVKMKESTLAFVSTETGQGSPWSTSGWTRSRTTRRGRGTWPTSGSEGTRSTSPWGGVGEPRTSGRSTRGTAPRSASWWTGARSTSGGTRSPTRGSVGELRAPGRSTSAPGTTRLKQIPGSMRPISASWWAGTRSTSGGTSTSSSPTGRGSSSSPTRRGTTPTTTMVGREGTTWSPGGKRGECPVEVQGDAEGAAEEDQVGEGVGVRDGVQGLSLPSERSSRKRQHSGNFINKLEANNKSTITNNVQKLIMRYENWNMVSGKEQDTPDLFRSEQTAPELFRFDGAAVESPMKRRKILPGIETTPFKELFVL